MKYTIELADDKGRGELYLQDGTIWCRAISTNETWSTDMPSSEETLADDMQAMYGNSPVWGLEVTE